MHDLVCQVSWYQQYSYHFSDTLKLVLDSASFSMRDHARLV